MHSVYCGESNISNYLTNLENLRNWGHKSWNLQSVELNQRSMLVSSEYLLLTLQAVWARFLAKNQMQSNEITKFFESIHWLVIKKCQNLTFKLNFLRHRNISISFFIEECSSRSTFFVKIIFWQLQLLNYIITKTTPNFWHTVSGWIHKIW